MKTNSIVTASNLRHLVCVSSALLLGALSLGCVAAPGGDAEAEEMVGDAADALTGFVFFSLSNNLGTNSVDMGLTSDGTCVLSGVAGNLSRGFQWYLHDKESRAVVRRTGGTNSLIVDEGAVDGGPPPWGLDNPVAARATCFPTTTNVQTAHWEANVNHSNGMADPVKIANLDPNHRRQCFLSGLTGVEGAWDHSWNWARVLEYTTTDINHPTTGWYVEGYLLSSDVDGSTPGIDATCVDFPVGTVFNSYDLDSDPGETKTEPITSGTGTKACGLTIINGPFNYNNYTDGVLINEPTGSGAQWTMTAKNGAAGRALCAK
ncbi:hypothetical protein WME89_41050 [Sorangium sp. So ce321]|uniref:hypothetical protein n=1 Tax=Sorangium sp. So ce321 TaxID=3133300 RepID=UPI003F5FCBF3